MEDSFVLFAAIAFWIYKTSPEFFYTFPKQEQTSKDKPVTPEANFNESKTEKTLENKGQQTEKQHAQTGNKEKISDKQPIEALDKTHKEHNYSAINVSDLTPARLTTIMGKAQTDATTRELLFNSFANNIIFMEIDENGNAIQIGSPEFSEIVNRLKEEMCEVEGDRNQRILPKQFTINGKTFSIMSAEERDKLTFQTKDGGIDVTYRTLQVGNTYSVFEHKNNTTTLINSGLTYEEAVALQRQKEAEAKPELSLM